MRIIGSISTAALVACAIACGGGDEVPSSAAPQDSVPLASSAGNRAPVIRSVRIDPKAPVDGNRVHAIVSVADEDGDPVQLGFEWKISGRLIPTGESFIDLSGVTRHDRIEVLVTASDGRLDGEPAHAAAKVRNRRPQMIGLALTPQPEVLPGVQLVATAQANDPDGDSIRYRYRWLLNGESQFETESAFATDGLVRGDEIQVIAVANDGSTDSDERKSIVVRVANSHPEIVSVPQGNWTDDVFSYQVDAHDPDKDAPLRYALQAGPAGMRIDSVLGKVVWKPTPDQAGVHPIEVAVSDPFGATSVQKFEITVRTGDGAPPASLRR